MGFAVVQPGANPAHEPGANPAAAQGEAAEMGQAAAVQKGCGRRTAEPQKAQHGTVTAWSLRGRLFLGIGKALVMTMPL